jgi:hypothetical protein
LRTSFVASATVAESVREEAARQAANGQSFGQKLGPEKTATGPLSYMPVKCFSSAWLSGS